MGGYRRLASLIGYPGSNDLLLLELQQSAPVCFPLGCAEIYWGNRPL